MIRPPEKISVILYEYPFNERIRTYLRLSICSDVLACSFLVTTPLIITMR